MRFFISLHTTPWLDCKGMMAFDTGNTQQLVIAIAMEKLQCGFFRSSIKSGRAAADSIY
jgi:hypothetical protein